MYKNLSGCTNVIALALSGLISLSGTALGQASDTTPVEPLAPYFQFTLNDINGKPTNLAQFKGKVQLLVNVASHCGFTGQYAGLQKLFEKYSARGFVVLGFPANDFGAQEPGTDAEIKTFCTQTYGVSFPMFAKISVKGESQHPLYKFLTEPATNPGFSGAISWNFNKFLISRQGKIIARFASKVTPDAEELLQAIEKALKE
ncbi:MAG: glutathione peroxidase [Candidatus Riflebacteria bacterium]|nr:glutathione peroxidase [Candidatus Riflebacteria bacterium]